MINCGADDAPTQKQRHTRSEKLLTNSMREHYAETLHWDSR